MSCASMCVRGRVLFSQAHTTESKSENLSVENQEREGARENVSVTETFCRETLN